MAVNSRVQFVESFLWQGLLVALKMALREGKIWLFGNFVKRKHLRALEKRTLGGHEHFRHQVFLAAREDEIDIGQVLDVAAQQGLHLRLGIFRNDLELIESHIARQF